MLLEALCWNAENVERNRSLGDIYVTMGGFQQAIPYYKNALTEKPLDPASLRGIAVARHKTGSTKAATTHYLQAVSALPDNAETHNNLGAALAQQGDFPRPGTF